MNEKNLSSIRLA